jgi:hypothetical protein
MNKSKTDIFARSKIKKILVKELKTKDNIFARIDEYL